MWHTENIAAGQRFTVPVGKIYEVFWFEEVGDGMTLNGNFLELIDAVNAWAWTAVWRPADILISIEAGGAAGVGNTNFYPFGRTCERGFFLSENDVLQPSVAGAFRVRWRDVTHRQ